MRIDETTSEIYQVMSGMRSAKRFIPWSLKRFGRQILTGSKFAGLTNGKHCRIHNTASVIGPVTLGRCVNIEEQVSLRNSSIDDYSYLGARAAANNATIGKFCSIGPEVCIGLGRHTLAPFVSTHPAFVSCVEHSGGSPAFADKDYSVKYEPITVGNDVWIGLRAAIKGGITVGDGAVVAAGAMVLGEVPPYAIVGGIPARLIRFRFPPDVISFLTKFRWWDRDEVWLRQNWLRFHDIKGFMSAFKPL